MNEEGVLMKGAGKNFSARLISFPKPFPARRATITF
jgi:hypothetical protein